MRKNICTKKIKNSKININFKIKKMKKIILIFLFFGIGLTTVEASSGGHKDKGLWEKIFGSDDDISGESYLPETHRSKSHESLFNSIFSSHKTEYYKPQKEVYGYADGKGPDPQPIPLDGGELVFVFMGILLWIRRVSKNGNYEEKLKFLAISKKEYRRYTGIMLLFVAIFMPIGILSDTIYIDMNIVSLCWLALVVLIRWATWSEQGMLSDIKAIIKKIKTFNYEKISLNLTILGRIVRDKHKN